MKDLFPGYYRPADDDLANLVSKALIVPDANVLLNLYRYPRKTSNDLIAVLTKVSNRLWVPHQVALDYQRNRLGVVADQIATFGKVQKIFEDCINTLSNQLDGLQLQQRHSSIDPTATVKVIQEKVAEFVAKLDGDKAKHSDVHDDDGLRSSIDDLLAGRVGPPPASQKWLDDVYKDGERRYGVRRPPGFRDKGKKRSAVDGGGDIEYSFNGLIFASKFGDLVLWKQLIEHVRQQGIKHVLLVIDDTKEDWWWSVESQGKKRLGPHPELVQEIVADGAVEAFYMYTSHRFMEVMAPKSGLEIDPESIKQIQDIATIRAREASELTLSELAELAVGKWIEQRHPDHQSLHRNVRVLHSEVDLIATTRDGQLLGYEVITAKWCSVEKANASFSRGQDLILQKALTAFWLVVVCESVTRADMIWPSIVEAWKQRSIRGGICVGTLQQSDGTATFVPLYERGD